MNYIFCTFLILCIHFINTQSQLFSDVDWTEVNTTGEAPQNVSHCASAVDGYKWFIFCGWNANHHTLNVTRYNDLYVLDTEARHWTKINTLGDIPPTRGASIMVRVKIRSDPFLFLFGGGEITRLLPGPGFQFQFFDDLHRYNISSNTWQRLNPPAPKPSGRIFLGGDSLLERYLEIFGGLDNTFQALNDHWRYDVNDNTWTQISGNKRPAPRTAMMYQRSLAGVIVSGGETWSNGAPTPNGESWGWNSLTRWSQQGNLPRPLDAMQYCSVVGIPVIYGGDTITTGVPDTFFPRKNITGDTYYLDIFFNTWRPLITQHHPEPNHFGVMAHINNLFEPCNDANGIWMTTGFRIEYTNLTDPNNIQFDQLYFNKVYRLGRSNDQKR